MTSTPQYYAPHGGHPPQTQLLTDRAVVTEAYTVIPKGVLRDIVTSVLPEWEDTRAWLLSRPVAGGATSFAQLIVEVSPCGGSTHPEPLAEVCGFVFVMGGSFAIQMGGQTEHLSGGGFALLPAGGSWQRRATGDAPARLQWIRKRYQPLEGYTPTPQFGQEQDIEPAPM